MRPLADNPYEAAARERKASRLAIFLAGKNITAADADGMDERGWNAAGALAGVHLPISGETRARTVDLLRSGEASRPADVFEGLG